MHAAIFRFVMIHHVTYQRLFGFEIPSIRANVALELSLVAVSGQVVLQGVLRGKTFVANQTHVGPFSRVLPHVIGEIQLRRVSFTANRTRVNSSVSCLVSSQSNFLSKFFTASRTHIGLFSRVSAHVYGKMLVTFKTLQANSTLMRIVVNLYVAMKTVCISKLLLTRRKFEKFSNTFWRATSA